MFSSTKFTIGWELKRISSGKKGAQKFWFVNLAQDTKANFLRIGNPR